MFFAIKRVCGFVVSARAVCGVELLNDVFFARHPH